MQPAVASAAPPPHRQTIVMIGDSLTAGLGLSRQQSIPAQLEASLRKSGMVVSVINAGVSGDTSAGGRARLSWTMREMPDLVIIEFGANDGLRGLDPKSTYENLDVIISEIKQTGSRIILAGMKAPPNLGTEYGDEFNRIYPELASRHSIALVPFFLAGVAAVQEFNQDDAIHPNARGASIIAGNLMPYVMRALNRKSE